MRRPRAFTCSGMHAEPLPPPPRKPLGYLLQEEGWTIGRSMRSCSPCQCGSCGRDSPSSRAVSTPPPSKTSSPVRFPERSRTNSASSRWAKQSNLSPGSAKTSSSPSGNDRSSSAVGRPATPRKTPIPGRAPTRRIVLFGESGVSDSEQPAQARSADGICLAVPFEQRKNQSERKRGSDEARGIVTAQATVCQRDFAAPARTPAPPLTSVFGSISGAEGSAHKAASFAVSTDNTTNRSSDHAASVSGLSDRGNVNISGSDVTAKPTSGPPGVPCKSNSGGEPAACDVLRGVSSSVEPSAGPDTGAISPDKSGLGTNWTVDEVQQLTALSSPSVAAEPGQRADAPFPAPGFPINMSSADNFRVMTTFGASMENGTTPNGFTGDGVVGLDEWRAPESVTGTFSLGSSGKDAGVNGPRRRLRMRVGG